MKRKREKGEGVKGRASGRKREIEREREREDSLGRVQPRHEGSEWEKALCNCNPDKYPEPRRTTNEQREERQRKRGSKRERRTE